MEKIHCNHLQCRYHFSLPSLGSTSSPSPHYFELSLRILHQPTPITLRPIAWRIWFQPNPPLYARNPHYSSWTAGQPRHLGPPRCWRLVCRPHHATLPLLPHPRQINSRRMYRQHNILVTKPRCPPKELLRQCYNCGRPRINPFITASTSCISHFPKQRRLTL